MKKRKKSKKGKLLLLLILIAMAAVFIQSEWLGRTVYPIYYQEEIKRGAQRYQLDPLLIAAIIRVESNYKTGALSRKGAMGIMQLMPDTAAWILEKEEFGDITVNAAGTNAQAGITLGAWYIKELMRQFDGSLVRSLAAYNAGPGKVRQWISNGEWDGKEQTISDIPYGETRHYVGRVLYYYKKYQKVYGSL